MDNVPNAWSLQMGDLLNLHGTGKARYAGDAAECLPCIRM